MTPHRVAREPDPPTSVRFELHPSEAECGVALVCFGLGVLVLSAEGVRKTAGMALIPVVVLAGVGVLAMWLFRLGFVLSAWKKRRGSLSRHKFAWFLLPLLLGTVAGLFWYHREADRSFDAADWREVRVQSKERDRWRMVADLRRNVLEEGMNRGKLLELLGPPDFGGWNGATLRWWLRDAKPPARAFWLEIVLDKDAVRGSSVFGE